MEKNPDNEKKKPDNEDGMPGNKGFLLVTAIDFGTSYSGYAWSTKKDFQNYLEGKYDEPIVLTNQACNSGGKGFFSEKTPTCLLLDAHRNFDSFGYDAENNYADLSTNGNHSTFYFFQKFKMNLHQGFETDLFNRMLQTLVFGQLFSSEKEDNVENVDATSFSFTSKEMMATELAGKQLPAFEVFALSIKALVDDFMALFTRHKGKDSMKIEDILWVLTVPAIWSEKSKQFMKRCAVKAGIPDKNLLIALEPECASVYCQHLSADKLFGPTDGHSKDKLGQKYIFADLGGGTVDIAVHEKMEGRKLKEIHRSAGSNCGGTFVDAAFIKFMGSIFGSNLIQALKNRFPDSYLDLLREFESKKRAKRTGKSDSINLAIPVVALSLLCEEFHHKKDIENVIKASPFKDQVSIKTDKMRIDASIFTGFFTPTIEKLIRLLQNVSKEKRVTEVEDIILVGGFSECTLVQDRVRAAFPNKRVIVPFECGLAVLKGAVIYGFNPSYIAVRIIKHTYGVDVAVLFDEKLHDQNHKFVFNDKLYSKSVFKTIMKEDSEVEPDTKVTREYRTIKPFQERLTVNIYVTNNENPRYVDERGTVLLGKLLVDIPNPTEEKRTFDVEFIFGNTEIKVAAVDRLSGEVFKTTLDLLTDF